MSKLPLFLKFDRSQLSQKLQDGVQARTIPEKIWPGRLPQIFIYPQPSFLTPTLELADLLDQPGFMSLDISFRDAV
jgi:hypothetical protein